MKKKKRKPLSIAKLTKKAEQLQRDYIFLTEGKICELCGKEAYCLDHVFSRGVRQLFFRKENLVKICQKCHFLKTHAMNGYDLKVFDFLENREGIDKFQQLWETAMNKKVDPNWNREFLEEKIEELKRRIDENTNS